MKSFRFEPQSVIAGSVLRRALAYLLSERELRYDPDRLASLNDVVFGERIWAPPYGEDSARDNWEERLYPSGDGVRLKHERLECGPCVGVVANRYAPPYLIGGLTNPITGEPNGEVRGGSKVDGLIGVNAIGFINADNRPDGCAKIHLRGVLVDKHGRSLNLSRFREKLERAERDMASQTGLIVVAGRSTHAGKTTCLQALVQALRSRGFSVTVEKKTGTACCRDWLRCHADPRCDVLGKEGDESVFDLDAFPARDFVDAMGIASDVSIDSKKFARPSTAYTRSYVAGHHPDFHVVELADSISHISNLNLLRSRHFLEQTKTLVYTGIPTHEAAAHLLAYWRSLGYGETPVVLSGPLANEEQYGMARDEIRHRLGLEICRSAKWQDGRWVPAGDELAAAVLHPPGPTQIPDAPSKGTRKRAVIRARPRIEPAWAQR